MDQQNAPRDNSATALPAPGHHPQSRSGQGATLRIRAALAGRSGGPINDVPGIEKPGEQVESETPSSKLVASLITSARPYQPRRSPRLRSRRAFYEGARRGSAEHEAAHAVMATVGAGLYCDWASIHLHDLAGGKTSIDRDEDTLGWPRAFAHAALAGVAYNLVQSSIRRVTTGIISRARKDLKQVVQIIQDHDLGPWDEIARETVALVVHFKPAIDAVADRLLAVATDLERQQIEDSNFWVESASIECDEIHRLVAAHAVPIARRSHMKPEWCRQTVAGADES